MKYLLITTIFLCSYVAKAQKTIPVISIGLDFRINPFDIEDIPRGPLPTPKGFPDYNSKFWQTISIHGQYGLLFKKNWLLSTTLYTRYNLLHRIENINYSRPLPEKVKGKNNFKYDLFLDIEKKIPLKKNKERYFLGSVGLGFTNINTKFDVTLNDTSEVGTSISKRYKGTMFHFGPRISLGYQYCRIKAYLNTHIIEGRDLIGLTALWIGGSLSYELMLKSKKRK